MFWVLCSGAPWRDLPDDMGHGKLFITALTDGQSQ
ncbi:hypothetical protein ECG581_5014, partial [Escherichia coli G58-1]